MMVGEPAERPEQGDRAPDDRADDELDRLVARSLKASERGSRTGAPPPPSRSPWPWLLVAVLLALLLGMLANPWFERQLRTAMPASLQEAAAPPAPPVPDLAPLADRLATLEAALAEAEARPADATPPRPEGDPASALPPAVLGNLEGRLAALESVAVRLQAVDVTMTERLDRLVSDVATIAGGSIAQQDQVRELLLVTALRRLFERGRMLSPLMPAVEARFQARDPDAVDALAAWNGAPVTRQSLAARLDSETMIAANPPPDGWWASLKQRMSGLMRVRDVRPGPEEATRGQVRSALLAGDLEQAIARMASAPATQEGNAWLIDARRLLAAEAALERMELATTDSLAQLSARPLAPEAMEAEAEAKAGE